LRKHRITHAKPAIQDKPVECTGKQLEGPDRPVGQMAATGNCVLLSGSWVEGHSSAPSVLKVAQDAPASIHRSRAAASGKEARRIDLAHAKPSLCFTAHSALRRGLLVQAVVRRSDFLRRVVEFFHRD
jgi:hypothetical protein